VRNPSCQSTQAGQPRIPALSRLPDAEPITQYGARTSVLASAPDRHSWAGSRTLTVTIGIFDVHLSAG